MFEISSQTKAATKPFLWGAVAGALALAIGGTFWPGYSLESTVKTRIVVEKRAALVKVLAPVCDEKFRGLPDLTLRSAALKETQSWKRDTYLVESGYVTPSGLDSTDNAVGEVCANLLEDLTK